jgi:hypothetical protein
MAIKAASQKQGRVRKRAAPVLSVMVWGVLPSLLTSRDLASVLNWIGVVAALVLFVGIIKRREEIMSHATFQTGGFD